MDINKIAKDIKEKDISVIAIKDILVSIYADGYSSGFNKGIRDIRKVKLQKKKQIDAGFREEILNIENVIRHKWI